MQAICFLVTEFYIYRLLVAVREFEHDNALFCFAKGADVPGFFAFGFVAATRAFPFDRLVFLVHRAVFELLVQVFKHKFVAVFNAREHFKSVGYFVKAFFTRVFANCL